MVLPTKRMRSASMPSPIRFSAASGLWVSSRSERRSVSTRLISSGIDQSSERRPDSTCATGIPSFEAASAQARVEFTSPATTTSSGACSSRTCSNAISTRPVWSPWVPEPTPRDTSGSGKPRSASTSSDSLAS